MKAKMFALAVFIVCGCWLLPASATITFTLGNNPQPDETNILFGASETGLTITGEVGHTGVAAIFSSLTGQTLLQMAKGQADIYNNALCPPPQNNHGQTQKYELATATIPTIDQRNAYARDRSM